MSLNLNKTDSVNNSNSPVIKATSSPEKLIERKILDRSVVRKYFDTTGISQLTGEPPGRLNLVIVRELLDNSLDTCDERYAKKGIKDVNVEFCVEKNSNGFLKIIVKDNGYGWSDEKIAILKDFTHDHSSRTLYKYPTRGLIGHAWKLIIGIVYAIAKECHISYDESPITIISKGKRHDINIEYDGNEPQITIKSSSGVEDNGWASIVSVMLPPYPTEGSDWLDDAFYLDIKDRYLCFNPHANITFKGLKSPEGTTYQKLGDANLEFREFIDTFTECQFNERIIAEAKKDKDKRTNDFAREIRYFSTYDAEATGFPSLLSDFSPEDRSKLYSTMLAHVESTGNRASSTLLIPLSLGKRNLYNRMSAIFPTDFSPLIKGFSGYKQILEKKGYQKIPYLVEVAVTLNSFGSRCIYFGINRSPKLSHNTLNQGYYGESRTNIYYTIKGESLTGVGIEGILEKNGIFKKDGVSVVIHLICPNMPYLDQDKKQINVTYFMSSIGKAVYEASHFYKSLKKKLDLVSEDRTGNLCIAQGTMTQKKAVFEVLPEAVDIVSSNDKYPYSVRNLWYKLREIFIKDRGWTDLVPTYKSYFTPTLVEQFRREYPNGEEILKGMRKEDSGELQEPRKDSVTLVSTESVENYEVPEWKYNKVLFIEKRGFKDLLIENGFHDKYDVAVVAGRGESSFDACKLLKKVEKAVERTGQKITLFCAHDADIYGLGIYLTLKNGSKNNPKHNLEIVDLGLTIKDAKAHGLIPERVPWPKKKDKDIEIADKIKTEMPEELRDMEGGKDKEGNKILNRIELNAFTPEDFLIWLREKLEEHGVKEKVRPPDEVVKEETTQALENSLTENIKNQVWVALGGEEEFVNALKLRLKEKWCRIGNDLDTIDVSMEMDKKLSEFPTEGWDDIIKEQVNKKIGADFENKEVKNEIQNSLIKALTDKKF